MDFFIISHNLSPYKKNHPSGLMGASLIVRKQIEVLLYCGIRTQK